jgi:excisionase family DNA binding protein
MAPNTAKRGGGGSSDVGTRDLVARRQLWPLNEVAYQLGISRSTLNRRLANGTIRRTRVDGRAFVTNKELERYLATIFQADGTEG